MFDLIANALRSPRLVVQTACTADGDHATRDEVESLFRADMDSFTRLAMDRRARKAMRPVALAA